MAGEHTRGGGCGLIRFNTRNLTSGDSRMKVSLMGLPDTLRSAAWPSSVRAVRCRVKSRKLLDDRMTIVFTNATNKTRTLCCQAERPHT